MEVFYEGVVAGNSANVSTDGSVAEFIAAPGSEFQVFELGDASRSNPLPVKVGGRTGTSIRTSDRSVMPDVRVISDNYAHIFKSGTFEWERLSNDGMKKAVDEARAAAQQVAAEVPDLVVAQIEEVAATGAFKGEDGKDGSNVVPTAKAIADEIKTPGTLANAALSATIVGQTAEFLKETVWTTASEIGLVADGNTARAAANDAALEAFLAGLTVKPGSFGATVVLYLPPGMYYFKDPHVFTQRIVVTGGGRSNTILRRAAGATGAMFTFNAAYSGMSMLALEGGRYQNTGTSGMDGLVVNGAYFSGRDLVLSKHTGWGLTVGLAGPAIGCQFDGVQMRSNLQGGLRTISGSGSTDCQWSRFDIGYMGGVGIHFGEGGQEFAQMHVWSSGMEDPVNNSGVVVTSGGNRGFIQSEKNLGYGIEIRASDQELTGRVWGNVKPGVFGSNANRVDVSSLAVYRNCVTNTTGSTATAFAAINLFNCLEWTMPKHVWDNANPLEPSSPPGEPAPTYPYPGKPAAFTHAWAVVETGTSDYNNYSGCIMKKQYTVGPSTNYPANFTGSNNQGANNTCDTLEVGLSDVPTQPVNSGIVRVPAWTDVIKVNAASTITAIAGNRPKREITIIFNGSGTGSVADSGTINLSAPLTPTPNTTLTLVGDGTNWYEKSRSTN